MSLQNVKGKMSLISESTQYIQCITIVGLKFIPRVSRFMCVAIKTNQKQKIGERNISNADRR